MIVKPYELDKIKIDLKFFLFYGKNEGLKKHYINQLLERNKNSNVIKYDDNGTVRRYRAQNPGTSDKITYPTHTSGAVRHGTIDWEYLGFGLIHQSRSRT